MDRSIYFQAITTMFYAEFHRDSQTWPSQGHKSCTDFAVIGCLCSTARQLLLITSCRIAALASARITAIRIKSDTQELPRGSDMVGLVAATRVIQKCLNVFSTPCAANFKSYTFSFHFKYGYVLSYRVHSHVGMNWARGGGFWQCAWAASPLTIVQTPFSRIHRPQAGQ